MILIADSGSTKTDWCLIRSNENFQVVSTQGLNPRFHTTDGIYQDILDHLLPAISEPVHAIHFYGAGCSSPHANLIVYSALQQAFPQAEIHIMEDLVGAARSLCGQHLGIACILGTGSNSCLYDGERIIEQMPNLGFLLGDEGSGAHLGKLLIQDFLNHELPTVIRQKFLQTYQLDRTQIIDAVYHQPFPNRYLASFTSFLSEHSQDEYIYQLIYKSFTSFFDKTICKYSNYTVCPTHFTGSIAYVFKDILEQVAMAKNVRLGKLIQRPLEGLVVYHTSSAY